MGEITRWLGQFREAPPTGVLVAGWPALAGWFEQGPHQGEATGLAGEPADDAGLLRSPNVLSMKLECRMSFMALGGELRVRG